MNTVHYIWIGGSEISPHYLANFQRCAKLNPSLEFKIWRNEECLQLISEYELMETFTPLTFICKYNLIKYLVLHKFGGIYTDFDILWKYPFSKIMNDYNFSDTDMILTSCPPLLIDDPFIISKPNILGGCITYCKNKDKSKWHYDGDLYVKTERLEIHKAEPFGPFSLTEWIQQNNVNYRTFPQKSYLDKNGFYGDHQQVNTWK